MRSKLTHFSPHNRPVNSANKASKANKAANPGARSQKKSVSTFPVAKFITRATPRNDQSFYHSLLKGLKGIKAEAGAKNNSSANDAQAIKQVRQDMANYTQQYCQVLEDHPDFAQANIRDLERGLSPGGVLYRQQESDMLPVLAAKVSGCDLHILEASENPAGPAEYRQSQTCLANDSSLPDGGHGVDQPPALYLLKDQQHYDWLEPAQPLAGSQTAAATVDGQAQNLSSLERDHSSYIQEYLGQGPDGQPATLASASPEQLLVLQQELEKDFQQYTQTLRALEDSQSIKNNTQRKHKLEDKIGNNTYSQLGITRRKGKEGMFKALYQLNTRVAQELHQRAADPAHHGSKNLQAGLDSSKRLQQACEALGLPIDPQASKGPHSGKVITSPSGQQASGAITPPITPPPTPPSTPPPESLFARSTAPTGLAGKESLGSKESKEGKESLEGKAQPEAKDKGQPVAQRQAATAGFGADSLEPKNSLERKDSLEPKNSLEPQNSQEPKAKHKRSFRAKLSAALKAKTKRKGQSQSQAQGSSQAKPQAATIQPQPHQPVNAEAAAWKESLLKSVETDYKGYICTALGPDASIETASATQLTSLLESIKQDFSRCNKPASNKNTLNKLGLPASEGRLGTLKALNLINARVGSELERRVATLVGKHNTALTHKTAPATQKKISFAVQDGSHPMRQVDRAVLARELKPSQTALKTSTDLAKTLRPPGLVVEGGAELDELLAQLSPGAERSQLLKELPADKERASLKPESQAQKSAPRHPSYRSMPLSAPLDTIVEELETAAEADDNRADKHRLTQDYGAYIQSQLTQVSSRGAATIDKASPRQLLSLLKTVDSDFFQYQETIKALDHETAKPDHTQNKYKVRLLSQQQGMIEDRVGSNTMTSYGIPQPQGREGMLTALSLINTQVQLELEQRVADSTMPAQERATLEQGLALTDRLENHLKSPDFHRNQEALDPLDRALIDEDQTLTALIKDGASRQSSSAGGEGGYRAR